MFWALIVKFELLTCFINVVVMGGKQWFETAAWSKSLSEAVAL